MFKTATTVLFLLLFSFNISAQEYDKKTQRAIKTYQAREYISAIQQFKKILSADDQAYLPLKYIANSYRKINQYNTAESFYNLVVNSDSVVAEDYLNYGQTLRANGKLAAAKEQFEKFTELSDNKMLGNLLMQTFDEVKTWENQPKKFLTKQGQGLNSPESEYGFLTFLDKFYITSNREKNYNSPELFNEDESSYTSMFELDTAQINSKNAEFEEIGGNLNTDYFDGPMTINKAQNKCVIMRIDNQLRGKKFQNKMKLYEGEYKDGKWKSFKALPFNSDEYSNGHPVYGETDNELYFISDKPGGFGGFDIYLALKKEEIWQEPKNLGTVINSRSNEVFPYYRKNKLYFSSDGFSGYGGLDLLVSEFAKTWQAPINMKSPINSSRDDFGIFYITDSTGYYTSNREGGMGKDDIYSFLESSKSISIAVSGIFEYKSLPSEGTKIILVNGNDSIIAVQYTDANGRFRFDNLPYNEDVFIKLETDDSDLYQDGRLYLTDDNGAKIKLIERLKNGKFKFKALPAEETKQLALLELIDNDLVKELQYKGKIYKKLPGDFEDEVMVYLLDDSGTIIDSVLSSHFGNFEFKKLGLVEEYSFFVKLVENDPELNIAFINKEGRYYKLSPNENGKYDIGNEDDIRINNGYTGVIAKAESFGIPLPYTQIDIYNNKTNVLIATLYSNEFGEFQFNKLNLDGDYYFRIPDISDSTRLNTKLFIIDNAGKELYLLRRLIDGKFSFTALTMDEYIQLQLLEESLVPKLVELNGKIYKKLPGDYSDKLKVYLLDESGNVIDSVFTDKSGGFNFEKLDPDRNYSFKLEEKGDFNLALLDKNNEIFEQAIINEKGNFTYTKLTYQVSTFEQLEAIDATLIVDEFNQELTGQVYQKLPGDFKEGMEVYIYDENGKLVGTSYTDAKGNFTFKKLKTDGNYHFRIEHHEEDFQLLTLDGENNILDKTIKNKNGRFKYKQLKSDHHSFFIEDAIDHHQVLYFDEEKIELDEFTVYYRFDSVKLNTVSKIKLQEFARLVKDEGYVVEVHSYADIRGNKKYNQKLSESRTNSVITYLIDRGFKKSDLFGNYYGELNAAVDCTTKKCDNDDHALNRRTIVKLRQKL